MKIKDEKHLYYVIFIAASMHTSILSCVLFLDMFPTQRSVACPGKAKYQVDLRYQVPSGALAASDYIVAWVPSRGVKVTLLGITQNSITVFNSVASVNVPDMTVRFSATPTTSCQLLWKVTTPTVVPPQAEDAFMLLDGDITVSLDGNANGPSGQNQGILRSASTNYFADAEGTGVYVPLSQFLSGGQRKNRHEVQGSKALTMSLFPDADVQLSQHQDTLDNLIETFAAGTPQAILVKFKNTTSIWDNLTVDYINPSVVNPVYTTLPTAITTGNFAVPWYSDVKYHVPNHIHVTTITAQSDGSGLFDVQFHKGNMYNASAGGSIILGFLLSSDYVVEWTSDVLKDFAVEWTSVPQVRAVAYSAVGVGEVIAVHGQGDFSPQVDDKILTYVKMPSDVYVSSKEFYTAVHDANSENGRILRIYEGKGKSKERLRMREWDEEGTVCYDE